MAMCQFGQPTRFDRAVYGIDPQMHLQIYLWIIRRYIYTYIC